MEVENLAISNIENNMEENKNIILFRIQEEDEEIVPLNKSNVDLDKLIKLIKWRRRTWRNYRRRDNKDNECLKNQ